MDQAQGPSTGQSPSGQRPTPSDDSTPVPSTTPSDDSTTRSSIPIKTPRKSGKNPYCLYLKSIYNKLLKPVNAVSTIGGTTLSADDVRHMQLDRMILKLTEREVDKFTTLLRCFDGIDEYDTVDKLCNFSRGNHVMVRGIPSDDELFKP